MKCFITKKQEECGGHCEHCILAGTDKSNMYDGGNASDNTAWEKPEDED